MTATAHELVDIVDETDRVVGQTTRANMRRDNILHRNVAVLCKRSDGAIYIQKRSDHKDLFPGRYDMFVGGVVGAGESYAHAAQRELAEELGVRGPVPTWLFHHRYEGQHTRSHTHVFEAVWDGPIVWQASEVVWGGYRTCADIVHNRDGFVFVDDGVELFECYRARFGC